MILLAVNTLFGQEIHSLSLDDCLQRARERSYRMLNLQEDFKVANYQLKAAVNRFKTHVDLDLTVPDYSETVSSLQDSSGTSYFQIKQTVYSGYLNISQPLPTDGQIYIRSGIYHLQDVLQDQYSFRLNTRIGFEQPLEAFYSYNHLQSSLKQAELNYELSKRRLTRARLDLDYEISTSFYRLFSAIEQRTITAQTLGRQEEAFNLAVNKFKAGVIAEVEALQMEVDLGQSQNNYDVALTEVEARANQLKQLLGFSLQDSIFIEIDLTFDEVDINLDMALEFGLKNRLEIRENEIRIEQADIDIAQTKVDHQITGKISAYYDLIGVDQRQYDYGLNSILNNAASELKTRPGNRGIALSFKVPLWDWGVNEAKVQAATSGLRQARLSLNNEKVSIEREIRDAVNNFRSSLRRLKLLEKNVEVAERSFEISQNRFANGDINSQSLALDRNRLTQAQYSRLNALIDYKLLLKDLTRKTFYDFQMQKEVDY